eukprot:gene22000-30232_t
MTRKTKDEESALNSSSKKPSRTKKDPSPAPIKKTAAASEEQPQPSAAAHSDPTAPSDPAVPSPSGEEKSLLAPQTDTLFLRSARDRALESFDPVDSADIPATVIPATSAERVRSVFPKSPRSLMADITLVEEIQVLINLGVDPTVAATTRAFSHLKRPENLKHMDFECPPNLLVDVRGTVASIVSLIERHITLVYRVPPLLIARLFRGGKKTVLKLVFEQLRLQQDTLPIIISLNDGFMLRKGESLKQAILNAIAFQFIEVDPTEYPIQFQCDNEVALLAHIASLPYTKVVLLIDELNLFTSHQPINIEAEVVSSDTYLPGGGGGGGGRTVLVPDHLPQTNNLDQLQGMPGCGAITRCELSLYGGIPSLLYTSKNLLASEMPRSRFNRYWGTVGHLITEETRTVLYSSFLRELRTGVSATTTPSVPKLFDSLASHYKSGDDKWFKYWPLCYIECILYEFGVTSMREIADALVVFAAQTESGKDWECKVSAAGSTGIAGVSLKYLPAQGQNAIKTIDEALTLFRSMKLPHSHDIAPTIIGFQCKQNRTYPKYEVPKGISQAVLLRGNAPSATLVKKKEMADWGEVPLNDAFD